MKFHEYIPYGLVDLSLSQMHGWTRAKLNALPPFFQQQGHKNIILSGDLRPLILSCIMSSPDKVIRIYT